MAYTLLALTVLACKPVSIDEIYYIYNDDAVSFKYDVKTDVKKVKKKVEPNIIIPSRGGEVNASSESIANLNFLGNFRLSAYDLSYQSCQKYKSDPGYGVTASGVSLRGLDISSRKIAVDTRVIPLSSFAYIQFPEDSRYVTLPNGDTFDLNGVYQAVDTGGAIKGNKLDLFVGENAIQLAYNIGVKNVKVYLIK